MNALNVVCSNRFGANEEDENLELFKIEIQRKNKNLQKKIVSFDRWLLLLYHALYDVIFFCHFAVKYGGENKTKPTQLSAVVEAQKRKKKKRIFSYTFEFSMFIVCLSSLCVRFC